MYKLIIFCRKVIFHHYQSDSRDGYLDSSERIRGYSLTQYLYSFASATSADQALVHILVHGAKMQFSVLTSLVITLVVTSAEVFENSVQSGLPGSEDYISIKTLERAFLGSKFWL